MILVVEDNQDSRELVVKVLTHKGYTVIEAVDGEDALKKVSKERPALILMDISLPKLDGYEVTRRLKAMEDFSKAAQAGHLKAKDQLKAPAPKP
jgi:two-component system cell cycle response regulator DivK